MAFQKISDEYYPLGKNALPSLDFFLKPNVILTPREATFKPKRKIPLNESVGCISGELITSYPPGIPIICPGEEITDEIINYCQWLSNQPSYIFAEDKTLSTISILNL
jgi:arginine/lysine/ornithine decarboxylase